MRVLVGVWVDVGLVGGECVEERHGPAGVGVDDPRPRLGRVVRGHTAVLLVVEVTANLELCV